MVAQGRTRLPSFEVQKETRAILAAAMSAKRLPASISEIDGLIVTEKNTFINITEATDDGTGICSELNTGDASPILSGSFSSRKGTEGFLQIPSRERGLTYISTGARYRNRSCPPQVAESEEVAVKDVQLVNECEFCAMETPVSRFRSRRHYSVDCSQHTSPIPAQTSPSSSLKPVDESLGSSVASTPTDPSPREKTTVMLRNVPYGESQVGVLDLVVQRGFGGRFDFFYAPLDFSSGNNLGYAFINLPDPSAVSEFYAVFDGLRVDKEEWSQKDLQVCWARVQGLKPNVEHYRNSPVNDMPEHFRPMIFDSVGKQLCFPRPDENVVRRPIPTTSMYSGGHRGVGGRPRFASAHISGPNSGNTASRRRSGGLGSFQARPL